MRPIEILLTFANLLAFCMVLISRHMQIPRGPGVSKNIAVIGENRSKPDETSYNRLFYRAVYSFIYPFHWAADCCAGVSHCNAIRPVPNWNGDLLLNGYQPAGNLQHACSRSKANYGTNLVPGKR